MKNINEVLNAHDLAKVEITEAVEKILKAKCGFNDVDIKLFIRPMMHDLLKMVLDIMKKDIES